MSYSEIKVILPSKEIITKQTLHNSWGFASLLWDYLFFKYVPQKHEYDHWLNDSGSRLWNLCIDPQVPTDLRTMMLMTCDYGYIKKEHFGRAIKDITNNWQLISHGAAINHWPAIADFLKNNSTNDDIVGVCFRVTSVSSDIWNLEDDDGNKINIDWDKTYSVYDEINKQDDIKGV
jgi:hypothetical protein